MLVVRSNGDERELDWRLSRAGRGHGERCLMTVPIGDTWSRRSGFVERDHQWSVASDAPLGPRVDAKRDEVHLEHDAELCVDPAR